ncbi:GOLPH3/VPS74 family protein, partial [Lapillicoccus sp.]|uniref:GOLPH3/VPS74 family protein n=1 Tax=Lapillicoccus sp. TaxID=1909287 RepID=UPI003983C74E
MTTLIAEDLLLLLLDDESGRAAASTKIRPLLGGALLIELAMMERIDMPEKPGLWRRGMSKVGWSTSKVSVLDGPPLDDPLLAAALATIGEMPRYAADLINRLGKGTKDVLLERLGQRELVRPVEDKVWGLFPRTTWPAIERTHEAAVKEKLQGVLIQGLSPDERTSVIISLLSGIDHAQ